MHDIFFSGQEMNRSTYLSRMYLCNVCMLASFPGTYRSECLVLHCLHMCGSQGFSEELGNLHKYTVLTLVCQSISLVSKVPCIYHALWKQ